MIGGVSSFKFRVSSLGFGAHAKPETRNLKLSSVILHSLFLILTLSLSGCQILGIFASKVMPIPDVPATYTPVKDFTLVLVESYNNPSSVGLASEYMTRQIVADMVDHRAAPIVNPDILADMRHHDPAKFEKMEIAAIGREVGAHQVLYVDVREINFEQALGTQMIKAHAEARVKFVDAATGHTLWPIETNGGYPVTLDSPFANVAKGTSETTIRNQVSRALANQIAKLFYPVSGEDETETHQQDPTEVGT
jgi:hypothetical protein